MHCTEVLLHNRWLKSYFTKIYTRNWDWVGDLGLRFGRFPCSGGCRGRFEETFRQEWWVGRFEAPPAKVVEAHWWAWRRQVDGGEVWATGHSGRREEACTEEEGAGAWREVVERLAVGGECVHVRQQYRVEWWAIKKRKRRHMIWTIIFGLGD
jgi:hypothetical protein